VSPRRKGMSLLGLALAVALAFPARLPAFHHPSLPIGSGAVTGADYAASSAIAKVFNRQGREYGVRLVAIESAGSLANIEAVLAGRAAFGIAPADALQQAARGLGPWTGRPGDGLRAVLGLHVEALTVVATRDRGIAGIRDLQGRRVNVGSPGANDRHHATALLEAAGVPQGRVRLLQHPSTLAPELLARREIDAFIAVVGHPNLVLAEASAGTPKVRLLPLDLPLVEQAAARSPLLFPARIPTEYYPGLEPGRAVPTLGVRAVLFTRADTAEEAVGRLVGEILTHFDYFQRQHPLLRPLTPRDACGITAIPAHPGAERACREGGLIP